MKKWLFLIPVAALCGGVGFFAEPHLFRSAPSSGDHMGALSGQSAAQPMLFNMPLGTFTLRVTKGHQILHLLLDVDVYVQGAAEFEAMGGAMGRAQLRDGLIAAIADIAETAVWSEETFVQTYDLRLLAEQIVHKLHANFPMIVTARINTFAASISVRE